MLVFVLVVVVTVAAAIVAVVAAALNFCPAAVKERAKSQFAPRAESSSYYSYMSAMCYYMCIVPFLCFSIYIHAYIHTKNTYVQLELSSMICSTASHNFLMTPPANCSYKTGEEQLYTLLVCVLTLLTSVAYINVYVYPTFRACLSGSKLTKQIVNCHFNNLSVNCASFILLSIYKL